MKEVEKQLSPSTCSGGLELNAPLIHDSLIAKNKKTKKNQKGHGIAADVREEQLQIERALQHPIKVFDVRHC